VGYEGGCDSMGEVDVKTSEVGWPFAGERVLAMSSVLGSYIRVRSDLGEIEKGPTKLGGKQLG